MKVFKACLLSLILSLALLFATEIIASAESDGTIVKTSADLFDALGGDETCLINNEIITLCYDTCLDSPIILSGGDYYLKGAGAEISSASDIMFVLKDGATLSVGSKDTPANSEGIIFNGKNSKTLFDISEKSTVEFYSGNTVKNYNLSAVVNYGYFIFYNGTVSDCGCEVGEGGFLNNFGEAILAGGTVKNCQGAKGGAVINRSFGKLQLVGTEFNSCHADLGGTVYNDGEAALTASYLSESYAIDGGTIYNSGTFLLPGGQISSSSAHGNGGTIFNTDSGEITLSGLYCDNATAEKDGGIIYNLGSLIASDGYLTNGTSVRGGIIYNGGKLELSGLGLSSGNATLGGGVFNCGSVTLSGGSFSLNKAEFGTAIFNSGNLTFSGFPYIDTKYDVFIDTSDSRNLPNIASEMAADTICRLTPGIYGSEGASLSYLEGSKILQGEYADSFSHKFAITSSNTSNWIIENSSLKREKTIYEKPVFYILIVLSYLVFVAVITVLSLFVSKKI